MTTWYRTDKHGIEIDTVEAEEERAVSIRFEGGWIVPKRGDVHNYFPTREEAVHFLKARCERRITNAESELRRAQAELQELLSRESE